MNVVILAGGLGTRFKELSVFPKILLPTPSGKTILQEQLEYFKNDSVELVVNQKYYNMVCQYLEVNNIIDGVDINLRCSTNTNGSGNTLAEVYEKYSTFPTKNVLFFWSDILFENEPTFYKPKDQDSCVIYTIDNKSYRYQFKDGHIVNHDYDYDGNVPGIFWISDVTKILPKHPVDKTMDLVDFLKDSIESSWVSNVKEYQIKDNNIIEYRSLEDYKRIMEDNSSFFDNERMKFVDDQFHVENTGQYSWYNMMRHLGLSDICVEVKPCHTTNLVDMSEANNLKPFPSKYAEEMIDEDGMRRLIDDLHSIYKEERASTSIKQHQSLYSQSVKEIMSDLEFLIPDFDETTYKIIEDGYDYIMDNTVIWESVLSHGEICQANLMYFESGSSNKTYYLLPPSNTSDLFLPKSYDEGCMLMLTSGMWNDSETITGDQLENLRNDKVNAVAGLLISLSRLTCLKNDLIKLSLMYHKFVKYLKDILK